MRTNRIAVRPDIRSANTCAPGTSARSWRCKMPKLRTIGLLVAAATSLVPHNSSVLAETQPCRPMEYERNPYTICEVDLRKHMLRLYWKNSEGMPYAYLSSLPRSLMGGGRLLFRHECRHVRSGTQACGALCGTGAGARARKHHVGPWQFSHEAEWGLLCIWR